MHAPAITAAIESADLPVSVHQFPAGETADFVVTGPGNAGRQVASAKSAHGVAQCPDGFEKRHGQRPCDEGNNAQDQERDLNEAEKQTLASLRDRMTEIRSQLTELESTAELEAFYRFLNNDAFDALAVLEPHRVQTFKRAAAARD